jgi:glycosyltransferase involved in cell wall biosynthesis
MADPGPLRVLQVAELCNPDWVSVPFEGWQHGRALALHTRSHLVTQYFNAENIAKAGLREGQDFTALDTRAVLRPLQRLARLLRGPDQVGQTTQTAFDALAYYFFEHLLWRRFGPAVRRGEYDVVHRLTPLTPTAPSLIARRCRAAGVPFVLGPLNGGLPWPPGFDDVRRSEREWLSYVRAGYKLLPGYRSTRSAAAAVLTGSRATHEQLGERWLPKAVYVPENGVDLARFDVHRTAPAALPLRVAFMGRLVPYKGADMLLAAAADLARRGQVVVEIIGDGVELPKLRAFAEREQLGDGARFPGWVKHAELKHRLVQCDLFGFPSIREFGGAVVLEAMALGLVPVVVDYGGPGEHVSPASGFAVPLGRRDEIVARLRAVLEALVRDPSVLGPMGRAARERVRRHFTWQAKAEQVLEVYRWVTGRRADKPDFGLPLRD